MIFKVYISFSRIFFHLENACEYSFSASSLGSITLSFLKPAKASLLSLYKPHPMPAPLAAPMLPSVPYNSMTAPLVLASASQNTWLRNIFALPAWIVALTAAMSPYQARKRS